MATAYFIMIVSVEHDGNCSSDEICEGLGAFMSWANPELGLTTAEGIQGELRITECLGVDPMDPAELEELIKARRIRDGT